MKTDYRQTDAGKRRFENPEVYKKTLEFQMYLQSQGVAWHNIFADECTNDFCCCTGEGEYKTYFPSNQVVIKEYNKDLYENIKHGDNEHMKWLSDKMNDFVLKYYYMV